MFEGLTILAGIIVALGGSGGVFLWYLNRRKNKAEGVIAEHKGEEAELHLSLMKSDTFKKLEGIVKQLIAEKLDATKEIYALELAKSNLETLLKVQKEHNESLQRNLFEVLREQGEAKAREQHCQTELVKRKEEIAALRKDFDELRLKLNSV